MLAITGFTIENNIAILDALYGIEKVEKVDAIAIKEKGTIKISLITPPKNFLTLSLKSSEGNGMLTGKLEMKKRKEKKIIFSKTK